MGEPTRPAEASVHVPGYEVGERIGAGGFGEVYRARHALMGRDVAIKILNAGYSADPDAVARFVSEARAVARISHPNIVDVFDFGELADSRQYCVMELLRGRTLRAVLDERTRLPLAEALPILRAIAEAVDAAHGAGIAHRDLKPDNVFVVDGGGIKLIDFGLAKVTTDDLRVTATGSVLGTPLYMSPEQCRGKAITLATDAYSFGVLAYHVLAGELPFSGDALELALHHLNDPPRPPSERCAELSARCDRVVLALLAKDPVDRPKSLVVAIDAILGDAPLPPVRRQRRNTRRWGLVGGGLAALGAGVLVVRSSSGSAEAECALGIDRMSGIWDPVTREAIEARFATVDRPDVASTWRRIGTDLDAYAARWITLWDEACAATDRKTDKLLYTQRLTCLENAAIQLHGFTHSLATVDVSRFAHGATLEYVSGETASLDACTSTDVLREQRPSLPHHLQPIVLALAEQLGAALVLVHGMSGGEPETIDRGLAEIEKVTAGCEAIGLSGAREAGIEASHFVTLAILSGEAPRTPRAHAAIADAIRRAELAHDDEILAGIYNERGRLEVGLSVGDPAVIDDAVARGEEALHRSGHPGRLDVLRAHVEIRAGRLDQAVELLRADLAQPVRWLQSAAPASTWRYSNPIRARLVDVLARLGRHDDAIAEARALVAATVRSFGENHQMIWWARWTLEQALVRAGRVAEALDETDRRLAIAKAIQAPPFDFQIVHERRMAYALELGRTDLASQAHAAALAAGLTDDAIAGWGLAHGRFDVVRAAFANLPPARSFAVADALAFVDFQTGDLATMRDQAERVPMGMTFAPETWLFGDARAPNAWWLVAVADAVAGHRAAAETRLAALAHFHTSSDPKLVAGAYINDGWVLATLARWADARAAFEHARAQPIWSRNDSLAEVDAWLGLARLELGDPKSAQGPLEEALDVLMTAGARNGRTDYDGFHYVAPIAEFALARALWATGGDKPRARFLATQARDHFARLGHFKDAEREVVIRWLADHP